MGKMRALLMGGIAAIGATASAQSFNVDYDLYNGHPDAGAGAPSSTFGAASGQTGFWDSFPNNFDGPYYLRDLQGAQTSVAVYASGRGGGGGWNNPNISGDFKRLMADGERISSGFELRLEGLMSGVYDVFTYCLLPNGTEGDSTINIMNSDEPAQRAHGILGSNLFVEGTTHTLHTNVSVRGGNLSIRGTGPWPRAFLNGFQVRMVPEPSSVTAFLLVFAGYAFFGRRKPAR